MESSNSPQCPLNVLMASSVPKRREGGVAGMIYNLGGELEARGNHVTYLFLEDLIEPGSVSARFSELVFAFRLSRYIAENAEHFSVVNLHAPAGLVYGFKRRWLRSAKLPPYVMTLHGLEERRVHVMTREAKKGRAWNFSRKNRAWHALYHQPRFRWCIKTADAAHVVARDVSTLLQLKYNLDANRVAYIPSGVEPRFFIPREYNDNGSLRLLYAGSWLDQRGIFYIRDALPKLVQRIPGLRMTFAGCGVPASVIKNFFGEELKSTIDVRPVVPTDRMEELYSEHDVFLFPSLMEGLPSVLLEAMAAGMPVITTETCGMTDIVQDGVNGRLIEPANANAIEEAVVYFANSVESRRKLGIAAREAMTHSTWTMAAQKLEALFRRTIEREKGRAR